MTYGISILGSKPILFTFFNEWDKVGYFRVIGLSIVTDSSISMLWFYFLGINIGIGYKND